MEAKSIEVIARGALVKGGRLLTCRSVRRGTRYLPGGHVEWGETSVEALRREWMEELGVECEVGPFLGVEEQTYELDGEPVAEISTVFAVECDALKGEGAGEASPESHIRFEWVPLEALEESGMMPEGIRRALP
ncbi:MAG: NUDIX domain-containing protein, partial [Kiritimatiellae bacterium]|nr:NUDIX domain-containing protein [Kiritimatiellia bacterium]